MDQEVFDEEEALGFAIWVAELELLVGGRGTQASDAADYFQLLQKLLVTVERDQRDVVREHQRRCDDKLYDLIVAGAPAPVRRLAAAVMSKLYTLGDNLPLYSRTNSLLSLLTARDANQRSIEARAGILECLGVLSAQHGMQLATRMPEIVAAAAKHVGRASSTVQEAAFRAVDKPCKERGMPDIRLACAAVVSAIASAGAVGIWANGAALFGEAVAVCSAALDDPSAAVRAAFAAALGQLAAAAKSDAAQEQLRSQTKTRVVVLQRALSEALTTCMVAPFVAAASAGNRPACAALVQAWPCYVECLRASNALDDGVLVDLTHTALDMLLLTREPPIAAEELGAATASGEQPHAQACVAMIVQTAVLEWLQEAGQRLLLKRVPGVLTQRSPRGSPPVPLTAATLETLRLLLDALGEVSMEEFEELSPSLLPLLRAPSAQLRVQAAATLAALAVAAHPRAARLLRVCMGELKQALQALGGGSGGGTPRGSATAAGVNGIAARMDALPCVHGASFAVAGLVCATTKLPLSVPSQLLAEVFDLCRPMIASPASKVPLHASVERQGGYHILGALIVALPAESLGSSCIELLSLWLPALSKEAAQQLSARVASPVGDEQAWQQTVAADLQWRAAALDSLWAFTTTALHGGVVAKDGAPQFIKGVVSLLRPTLEVVTQQPSLHDPARGRGGPTSAWTAAAAQLQLALLRAYAALPGCGAYAKDHEALIRVTSRSVRMGADSGNATPAVDALLHSLLKEQDAVLGPWHVGRNPAEAALHAFSGGPGAPLPPPWTAVGVHIAGAVAPSQSTFVQSDSLACQLMAAQLDLLAHLVAEVSVSNQQVLVNMLANAATWGGQPKRAPKEWRRRVAVVGTAAAVALDGCERWRKRTKGSTSDALAQQLVQLASAVLEEATKQADANDPAAATAAVALQRAAAELFGLAAAVGGGAQAAEVVRAVCQQMAETTFSFRRQCMALAAACVHRTGGVHMQVLVTPALHTLVAVVRGSSAPAKLWALHALWIISNAAGPSCIQHVPDVQATMRAVLLQDDAYAWPGMRPTLGRLANALVAVMGPEFQLGSDAYVQVKSIIRDMQPLDMAPEPPAGGFLDVTAAEMERVLNSQMLILFAPHAVEPRTQLPLLLATLRRTQPPLRHAAAATLRHLAERDPQGVLPAHVERALLSALDVETSGATVTQLQATLQTLMHSGAPQEPLLWLSTLAEVATALPPSTAAETGPTAEEGDGDVDGEMLHRAAPAPAPARGEGINTSPRLRTRLFAATCLLQLPALLTTAPPTTPPTTLVSALVDVAFKMSTGGGDALRPLGLRLMQEVVRVFGGVEDPLMPGARLMDQHQAQIVSALRVSLAKGASPPLMAQGSALAALFLERGMAAGDAAVLERLLDLLLTPLSTPSEEASSYAEWVVARCLVALLEANAHCGVLAATSGDARSAQAIATALAPHGELLLDLWCSLLQDYSFICSQPPPLWPQYRPRLLSTLSPVVVAKFLHALERAWLPVLDAASWRLSASTSANRSMQWRTLMDVAFLAAAMATKGPTRAGAARGLGGPSPFSVPSGMAALGTETVEGPPSEHQGPARLPVVLHALARVVHATPTAAPGSMTADVAVDVLTLVTDSIQRLCVPMVVDIGSKGSSAACLAECCAALAQVLLSVVTAAADVLGDAAVADAAADALLQLLALVAPRDGENKEESWVRATHLDTLLPKDMALLDDARATALRAMVALASLCPRLQALLLAAAADSVVLLPEPGSAQAASAVADMARAVLAGGHGGTVVVVDVVGVMQVANGGGAVANDDDFDDGFGDFGDGGFADTTVHDTPAVEPADADTRGDVVASLTWQPHEGRVTVALNIAEAAVNTAVNAPPPSADGVASAQQRVLDELMAALTINDDRIVLAITQGLLRVLHGVGASHSPTEAAWACTAVGTLGAPLQARAHALLHDPACPHTSLSAVHVQVVSGVLKVFVAALAVARGLGEAAAHSLVTALLPLVLDVAAPEAGPAHPALRDLSLKLIQALATGPSALVFRGAVAALPPSSKQRLQSALQEQGSKRAPDSALKGPTIQLKTFGAASAT